MISAATREVFANPRDRHNAPGGLANSANWGDEVRLTPRPFDVEKSPQSTNVNGGYFLGDYQGLTVVGDRFVAFFSVAGTGGNNQVPFDNLIFKQAPAWNGTLNVTSTLSPTLTNEFIFGASQNNLTLNPSQPKRRHVFRHWF